MVMRERDAKHTDIRLIDVLPMWRYAVSLRFKPIESWDTHFNPVGQEYIRDNEEIELEDQLALLRGIIVLEPANLVPFAAFDWCGHIDALASVELLVVNDLSKRIQKALIMVELYSTDAARPTSQNPRFLGCCSLPALLHATYFRFTPAIRLL